MRINETLRHAGENFNLKKWSPAKWLVIVGILGVAAGSVNIAYCVNKIDNEVDSKYPMSSSVDAVQQRIGYKSQLEKPIPPGAGLLITGFVSLITGAGIDAKRSMNKEKNNLIKKQENR